jgi:hypothetical protein
MALDQPPARHPSQRRSCDNEPLRGGASATHLTGYGLADACWGQPSQATAMSSASQI